MLVLFARLADFAPTYFFWALGSFFTTVTVKREQINERLTAIEIDLICRGIGSLLHPYDIILKNHSGGIVCVTRQKCKIVICNNAN
jgi:hypothetical protein